MAEALLDELVEEILLRIAPDDPARLFRAALVCKRWRRLACDPGFRRRFREFHRRRPPMLGFLCNLRDDEPPSADEAFVLSFVAYSPRARFVPASSAARPADRSGWHALDSRHGRVLLYRFPEPLVAVQDLAVWDPVTDEQVEIPMIPQDPWPYLLGWNAAVLCAATATGCDHLDCHGGPFLVVFMFVGHKEALRMLIRVYSSESRTWSEAASATPVPVPASLRLDQPVLAGKALYFMLRTPKILKYDLATRGTSEIHFPDTVNLWQVVLMTTEDGRLGLARVEDFKLSVWSWEEAGSEKGASWAQTKVIELKTILPVDALSTSPHVLGVADGLGVIFVWTNAGLFTIDQKSDQVRKLGDVEGGSRIYNIVPHISFCTPVSSVSPVLLHKPCSAVLCGVRIDPEFIQTQQLLLANGKEKVVHLNRIFEKLKKSFECLCRSSPNSLVKASYDEKKRANMAFPDDGASWLLFLDLELKSSGEFLNTMSAEAVAAKTNAKTP